MSDRDITRFLDAWADVKVSDDVRLPIGDVNQELRRLEEELIRLQLYALPWDTWDYVTVFGAGIAGGVCDLVVGKPSGYPEPKIKDDSFFGLGAKLKRYDLTNNPIDKHIPGSPAGEHRLYSYGHDLFRLFQGLRAVMTGGGPIGIAGTGGALDVKPRPGWGERDLGEAVLILALHLWKDFWTRRSLPIPGTTWIAQLNDNQMPSIARELYRKDVNLRTLSGQALSMSIVEIAVRVRTHLAYRQTTVDHELLDQKTRSMLLASHSIALAFNVGKVVVAKNPLLLNVAQILRVVWLCLRAADDAMSRGSNAKLKVALQQVRMNLEGLRTVTVVADTVVLTAASATRYRDARARVGAATSDAANKLDEGARELRDAAEAMQRHARRLRDDGGTR